MDKARKGKWFHAALFRHNMRRYIPLMLINGGILILLNMNRIFGYVNTPMYLQEMRSAPLYAAYPVMMLVPLFLMALAAAMCLFSFRFQKTASDQMQALPIGRKSIFVTQTISAFVITAAPLPVSAIMELGFLRREYTLVQAGRYLALDLVLCLMFALLGLSIAVLCCTLSANPFVIPFLFVFLNGIGALFERMIREMASAFLFGLVPERVSLGLLRWLSPVAKLYTVGLQSNTLENAYDPAAYVAPVLVYTAAALLLFVPAWLLYRKFKNEQAGQEFLWKPGRYVVQYVSATMAAYVMILIAPYLWNFRQKDSLFLNYLIPFLAGGGLWFIGFEMAAQKRFRIFKDVWKRLLPYICVLALFVVLLETDPFGFEKRIPDISEIQSVALVDDSFIPEETGLSHDPDVIQKMHRLHVEVIRNLDILSKRRNGSYIYGSSEFFQHVRISYHLKNGENLQRAYLIDTPEPDSALKQAWIDLVTDPEFMVANWFGEHCNYASASSITVEREHAEENQSHLDVKTYMDEDARKLFTALLKDIRETEGLKEEAIRDFSNEFPGQEEPQLDLHLTVVMRDGKEVWMNLLNTKCVHLIQALQELEYPGHWLPEEDASEDDKR